MTSLNETSPSPTQEPVWRQGVLTDDEFERAALAIQPSWEVGLDRMSRPPAISLGATIPFTAPPTVVAAAAVAEAATVAHADLAPTTTEAPVEKRAFVRPVEVPASKPEELSTKPTSPEVPSARARASADLKQSYRALDDELPLKKAPSRGMMIGGLVGLLALGGIAFAVFGNSGPATPETPATTAAPEAPTPTPVAAPETPAPTPVAAPETPAPTPPPAAPEAPVAQAAPPPAPAAPETVPAMAAPAPEPPPAPVPAPPVVAAPVVHAPPPPHSHASANGTPRPRTTAPHAETHDTQPATPRHPTAPATGHTAHGAGFVTESPY